jgi:hypothetical protein
MDAVGSPLLLNATSENSAHKPKTIVRNRRSHVIESRRIETPLAKEKTNSLEKLVLHIGPTFYADAVFASNTFFVMAAITK